jgi:hypothetical protein
MFTGKLLIIIISVSLFEFVQCPLLLGFQYIFVIGGFRNVFPDYKRLSIRFKIATIDSCEEYYKKDFWCKLVSIIS